MPQLLISISLTSHALVALLGLVAGGMLGFLYSGRVQAKAQAAIAQAYSALGAEVKKL